jgi:hypothetical protein
MQEADDAIAEEVVSGLGECVVSFILEQLHELPDSSTWSWRRALRTGSRLLLSWLSNNKNLTLTAAMAAVSLLDPHSRSVHDFPVEAWVRIVELGNKDISRHSRVSFYSFFLALGFDNPGLGSEKLVSRSFQTIHDAAADDILPFDCWKLIERELPPLSFWRNWDKCERLRQGLIKQFIKYEWPRDEFLRCTEHETIFYQLLQSGLVTEKGTQFIRAIRNAVVHNKLKASEVQYRLLANLRL